jgi:hypothetical protein
MAELPKKTLAKFEQTSDAMPRLTAEMPAPSAKQAAPEARLPEVRSMRVPKLDQQTVWRVIETLKSL